jgi:hypothetical protein
MFLSSAPVIRSYILLTWCEILQQCSCTPQYVSLSGSLLDVGQILNSLFLPALSVSKFQFSTTLFLSCEYQSTCLLHSYFVNNV